MASVLRRDTSIADVVTTPYSHKYLVKRPVIKSYTCSSRSISLQNTRSNSSHEDNGTDAYDHGTPILQGIEGHVENPMVEKRRVELFIDLIWVAIIGNLAEHYSAQAYGAKTQYYMGQGLGEFIILFLFAIRMWKNLQDFMTKYHTNDFIERFFIIIYLALALLYGNSAPYILNRKNPSVSGIVIYMVAQGCITLVESVYSIFLPSQRNGILIRLFLIGGATMPLYIVACFSGHLLKVLLLLVGIVVQFLTAALIDTPLFERWLRDERSRPWDAEHFIERHQEFFIIILGEGVLVLIKKSPLGVGLSVRSGTGILVLCMYYMLSGLFFNGDSSRRYIHAVSRTGWRRTLHSTFHSAMFFFTLILGVSLEYLVKNSTANAVAPPPPPGLERYAEDPSISTPSSATSSSPEAQYIAAVKLASSMNNAKWMTAGSISFTVFLLTIIALLNRSLDNPKTMIITNRYIRLAPRIVFIVVVLCLPIAEHIVACVFVTIILSLLSVLVIWELTVSLERDGGFIEP